MAFVNQTTPDILSKLQPLNGFAACLWPPKASPCLPLNEKTWREASRDNWLGQACLKDFKNSPTTSDESLHKDLSEYQWAHPRITVLQYVLQPPSPTWRHARRPQETCYRNWVNLATKCLLRRPSFVNLRSPIWGTYSEWGRRAANSCCQTPRSKPSLASQSHQPQGKYRNFWDLRSEICRLWVPGFTEKAKLLLRPSGAKKRMDFWDGHGFQGSRNALALPDIHRSFHLYAEHNFSWAFPSPFTLLSSWERKFLSKKDYWSGQMAQRTNALTPNNLSSVTGIPVVEEENQLSQVVLWPQPNF